MARLDLERQEKLEPKRIKVAKDAIEKIGYQTTERNKRLEFWFKGYLIYYYPYSGWHSGKSIKDGRGLQNLLKQIKK